MTDQTTPIDIGYPEADLLTLRITVGACSVKVAGGGDRWVSGTYSDPSGKIPVSVDVEAGSARIRQRPDVESIAGIFQGSPRLDIALGADRPFALILEGGANDVELDLGGVPLTRLDIKHGAGQVDLAFDEPNPTDMERLTINTGAGSLEAEGLGHANFAEMVLEGGAAKYELSFDGALRRDASVRASTGAAGLDLRVPATVAARISARNVLGSIDIGDGFTTVDGRFHTRAAIDGTTPKLDIDATVAVGLLRLRTHD